MRRDLVDFLLTDLRARPGMYLTAYDLSCLDIFLVGVQITCMELDRSGEFEKRYSGENGFVQWSWQKYDLGHPSYKLDHYRDFARGDEKEALDLFFEDLELYISESGRDLKL